MKPIFIVNGLFNTGVSRVLENLILGLKSHQNIECTLLVLSTVDDYELDDSIKVTFYPILDQYPFMRKVLNITRLSDLYLLYEGGGKVLEQVRYLEKANGFSFTHIFIQTVDACKLCHNLNDNRIRYVLHNNKSTYYLNNKSFFRKLLNKFIVKKVYKYKKVIAVSEGVKSDFLQYFKVPLLSFDVIYNPFDFEAIESLSIKPNIDDIRDPYLLNVGRISDQKRQDILIEIFSKINYKGKLLIIGEGTEDKIQILRNKIVEFGLEDRVYLMGNIPNPYPYMKHAEALLLTSDYEGLPTVLIESLICGTVCVSFDCPSGPREILFDEMVEGLVEYRNIPQFKITLETVLKKPYIIPKDKLENKFSVNNIVQKYSSLK